MKILSLSLFSLLIVFSSCKKDPEPTPAPTTGTVSGIVTDFDTSSAIADVTVILFDAATNAPVMTTVTDASGNYSFEIEGGSYFIKFSGQGYLPNPPVGINPIPFTIVNGEITDKPAQMIASGSSTDGFISGQITDGSAGVAGVLVVAELNGVAYSAITDQDGNYSIFNVPAGTYAVTAFIAGYSSTVADAIVTASTETTAVDVTLTTGAAGSFNGTISIISQTGIVTAPTTMDISLVHPVTRETIPGLSQSVTYSSSMSFSFADLADGTYIVRASYANDYIVVDPNEIATKGEYIVTVSGGAAADIAIKATSAVSLSSPTNTMDTTIPIEVTSAIPTFTWLQYPSTSDYVIEVIDATTGTVIWGGFSNNFTAKNIVVNGLTIDYNSDGNATIPSLESGKVYQWKVYASKNDTSVLGWHLISSSEDQMGLIKIQ